MKNQNFTHRKTLTKSEIENYFIHLPRKLKVPNALKIEVSNEMLDAKIDKRNRMYISKLAKKLALNFGQKVKIERKDGKYYFTAI